MILDYVLDSDGEVIGAGESHDISRHVDKMLKEVFDAQQICGPSAEIVKTFAKRHFPFLSGKCRKDKLGYLWISKRMFWEE